MRKLNLTVILAMLFIVSCATPIKHQTASGRPEVTVTGRVGEQIVPLIIDRMLNAGYNVKTATNTLLVFEKPIDNMFMALMFASRYDCTPATRITYTIVETTTSTRVVASLAAISNPGSAFERVTSMNNSKDSANVQQFLTELKNSIKIE